MNMSELLSSQRDFPSPPKLSLQNKWPFKKHKSIMIVAVIDGHPSYAKWCLENTDIFSKLDKQAQDFYSDEMATYEQYLRDRKKEFDPRDGDLPF